MSILSLPIYVWVFQSYLFPSDFPTEILNASHTSYIRPTCHAHVTLPHLIPNTRSLLHSTHYETIHYTIFLYPTCFLDPNILLCSVLSTAFPQSTLTRLDRVSSNPTQTIQFLNLFTSALNIKSIHPERSYTVKGQNGTKPIRQPYML